MLGENIQCFITKKYISCELLTDDFYQVEEFFFYPLLADSFIITGVLKFVKYHWDDHMFCF